MLCRPSANKGLIRSWLNVTCVLPSAAGKVKGKQSMFLLYLDAVSVVTESRSGRGMPDSHGVGAPCEAVTCVTLGKVCHLKLHAFLRTLADIATQTRCQALHSLAVSAQASDNPSLSIL